MNYPIELSKLKEKAEGFFYLATPYTSLDPVIKSRRAGQARKYAGAFLAEGIYVISTIWQTHHIAQERSLPDNFEFWLQYNKLFLDASIGTIVCRISGWDTSRGVKQEIDYTIAQKKPLFYATLKGEDLSLERII